MKAKPSKHAGGVVLELENRDEPILRSAATGPFQIKRILVPIDYSDCATKALRYAIPLARQHGATIDLVHVISSPAYGYGEYGPIVMEPDPLPGSKKALQKLAEAEIPPDVPFNIEVRTGAAHLEISQFARSEGADLIVISTHGYTGFKHVLLGSVAEHVVRYAPCPVLVVRVHEHEFIRN
ncbi:MAG TPA: universal stress protein [Verrucomicrobiae bacterium]